MLTDEALDLTLRSVLRFAAPGREGREPVDVETLVLGLRALERVLEKQQAKREADDSRWLAGVFAEGIDHALAKYGSPPKKKRRAPAKAGARRKSPR
jgi:hypothetical protein